MTYNVEALRDYSVNVCIYHSEKIIVILEVNA
jgi:hypothetical protein